MDAELKAKWVAALRSGKYEQTTDSLRDPSGFCCLGVLCDLSMPDAWEFNDRIGTDGHPFCAESEAVLSAEALDKLGLTEEQQRRLVDMNDRGVPFPKIADEIERLL